jgi:AraC-like DNA-binding protein
MTIETPKPTVAPPPETGMPLVHRVLDVRRWERRDPRFHYEALSRHGHVVQCTLRGRCRHTSGGRRYDLTRGSVVWLDDSEAHACEVTQAPWVFCSIHFLAPSLPALPTSQSVRNAGPAVVRKFNQLLTVWHNTAAGAHLRALRVQALVASLLADILATTIYLPHETDETTRLWWELETRIRHALNQRISLSTLESWSHCHRAVLAKICHQATGTSPMKRVKFLRLSHAAGLLGSSNLMVKEIAHAVGYSRGHEFSRDYHKVFGLSPRASRAQHLRQVGIVKR